MVELPEVLEVPVHRRRLSALEDLEIRRLHLHLVVLSVPTSTTLKI